MKTSNKLLIALVLLLFAFPLALMMGFKAAIKNDRYIVKNQSGYKVSEPKDIKAFTAVTINGVPAENNFGLRAYIRHGDKFSYSIRNYDENRPEESRLDSCHISFSGDTLVVDYNLKSIPRINAPTNYYYGIEVDILLPHAVPVMANAARVIIDSSTGTLGKLSFALANNATLEIANLKLVADIENATNTNDFYAPVIFPAIGISAHNSNVKVDDNVKIKNLNVSLEGSSTINFRESVSIDTLSGRISDASFFNAPHRFSKFLN